ncbi:hypothetical protein K491DRAFT_697467 [Lophiostoma macrostomum CBS 122681]|uniref:Nucleoside 2-deoxyribosyltransferase n=1 Tax=Lophiostoma macrostomum CBS 122681 TaxID=1314788 RepID=A0A6A6SRH5_9PLEO|nr:hypothetical protein K491DRAFT_697467 [Lophiostoma macrostomum CBS 122681]
MTNDINNTTTTTMAPQPTSELDTPAKDLTATIPDTFNQLPPLPSPPLPQHPAFHHYKPPVPPTYPGYSVFLAGSIEMGRAIQWQSHILPFLHNLPLTICNPRRSTWDSAPDAAQRLRDMERQVDWELQALDACDVICFFFDKATMSPVTMMELGLWARSGKAVVCCDDGVQAGGDADADANGNAHKGFWKGTNVRMVCERYGVPHVRRFEELVTEVKSMLARKGMRVEEVEWKGESVDEEEEGQEGGVSL